MVDTWAFALPGLDEFMFMEHSRGTLRTMMPVLGKPLHTNRRRPILTLEEDTSPGVHDTLIAACDVHRYKQLGCTEHHDNCTDNLAAAMAELDMTAPETPCPLNLFMNNPWSAEGMLAFDPPMTKPGDNVTLRTHMRCVVALSACPMDMSPINGIGQKPTEVHYKILPAL